MNAFVIFFSVVLAIELCAAIILNSIALADIERCTDKRDAEYFTHQLREFNAKMFLCIAVTLLAILASYIIGVYIHGSK